jgi:LemA protein
MNKKSIGIIIGAIAAIFGILLITGQRSFVTLEEDVNNKWSGVQNAYQRRSDLIPNLVNVVKGGTDYEKNTLIQLTEARAKAASVNVSNIDFDSYQQQEQAQAAVTNNMNRVIAVVENYPDLKGTNQFRTLQAQLEGTERRIKLARKDFNEAIMKYNKKVRSFPWNVVGNIIGYKAKDGFKADAGAENAPEVQFK